MLQVISTGNLNTINSNIHSFFIQLSQPSILDTPSIRSSFFSDVTAEYTSTSKFLDYTSDSTSLSFDSVPYMLLGSGINLSSTRSALTTFLSLMCIMYSMIKYQNTHACKTSEGFYQVSLEKIHYCYCRCPKSTL